MSAHTPKRCRVGPHAGPAWGRPYESAVKILGQPQTFSANPATSTLYHTKLLAIFARIDLSYTQLPAHRPANRQANISANAAHIGANKAQIEENARRLDQPRATGPLRAHLC